LLRRFFLALQFLTISPSFWKGELWPEDLGRSVAFYPLIGALIGGALWGVAAIAGNRVTPSVRAFLLLVTWTVITGALHVDGFLDACDGLFGGMTPERRLEIMHDVHYGSFALAGGALLFLGKYAGLQSIGTPAILVLIPVLGRWGMALSIWAFPYARKEGLGKAVKDGMRAVDLAAALLTSLLISAFLGWKGLAAWGIGTTSALTAGKYASAKLSGGITGDIYGAVCEVTELITLLGIAVLR